MNWAALAFQVGRLRLDVDIAAARMIELELRAKTADGRAESALARLLALTDKERRATW